MGKELMQVQSRWQNPKDSQSGASITAYLTKTTMLRYRALHVVGPRLTERRGVLCKFSDFTSFCGILGWGDDNIPCACTHVGCYATGLWWVGGGVITFLALAHMLDATQLVCGGWGGMITFLALAHMLDATQLVWGGWG